MDVHPGPEKRRVAQVKLAQVDLIRRALSENEDWYQDLVCLLYTSTQSLRRGGKPKHEPDLRHKRRQQQRDRD